MSLVKIENYNANYKDEIFRGNAIDNFEIHESINQKKVGSLYSILVDQFGHLRYVVIDAKFWGLNKKILLPIGRCRIDYSTQRIYALNLTKDQVEKLPEYNDNILVNYDYEEAIRSNYRLGDGGQTPAYDRSTYSYESEPELYNIREADQGFIKLYEERLLADKNRYKIGEVAIGKTIKTETARASVPVEKERVIIQRNRLNVAEKTDGYDESIFREGEVVRMEVYEETANIRKEAFVSEEVSVKKVVERDVVIAEETLRREELTVGGEGNPIIQENQ